MKRLSNRQEQILSLIWNQGPLTVQQKGLNDSVIMAPTVNCRIESGCFFINSPDKALILKI